MPENFRIFYKKEFLKDRKEKKKFRDNVKSIINFIAGKEKTDIRDISIIFCSDRYIRKINKEFLNHDYETDIITFYDSGKDGNIEGELFISVDSVRENSNIYNSGFRSELSRVIIHGILHLCGYNDKTLKQRSKMRLKENYYLKNYGHV